MENSNKIDFIIVSFKNTEYVKLALESVEKFVDHPYDVTIIDNGDDVERYKEIYKDKKTPIPNLIGAW